MRGASRILVAVLLVASGCSLDLEIETTDQDGNRIVVPVGSAPDASAESTAAVDRPDTDAPARDRTPTPAAETNPETATVTPATIETPTAASDDTAPPPDDDGTVATEPTPEVAGTPSATDPLPLADPTAVPSPTSVPTPAPDRLVIAPDAPLLGVALGTDASTAISELEATIGPPDFDSGWYVGCPLDGDDQDERLVQWGDLNVYLDRFDGAETFAAWGYDLRIVDGGFPEADLIELPGGSSMGDPIDQVAAAARLPVRYDDRFRINRVGEPGYEIVADAPPDAPVWGAFVPAIPTCE